MRVAGNEALRQHHLAGTGNAGLQRGIGRVLAGCRQVTAAVAAIGTAGTYEHFARVHPLRRYAHTLQVSGAEARGHELPEGHDAHPDTYTDLAHQANACNQLVQFLQGIIEQCGTIESQFPG